MNASIARIANAALLVATYATVVAVLLCGCTPQAAQTAHPPTPRVTSLVWSSDIDYAAPLWRREAAKRFSGDTLIVVCHGDDFDGVWMLYPDSPRSVLTVNAAAQILADVYPDHTIIFVTCNPKLADLRAPRNVYYAKGNVWAKPDQFFYFIRHSKSVGSIDLFVSAKP